MAEAGAAAARPVIEVQGFERAYRDTIAVSDLHFDVHPGQILGLVGPNGGGKTTTLRAIAGVIPPTRGTLRLAGHDVVKEPVASKAQLGFVPDDPRLFDVLTVWEHLQFVASAYRVRDAAPQALRLLEEFDLAAHRDKLAAELSRGLRQKLAVCCAYLHAPPALLFDEPLTGLDPGGIRVMKSSVAARARAGAAVIISSHLLALVEDLCTHLLILHRGRRVFFGRMDAAPAAFPGLAKDASLETVFFRAMEGL
jgi:ABC-2 type transport system ATP-binding protein